MAFLDDLEQWVLVIFREKLPAADADFVASKEHCGMLSFGAVSALLETTDTEPSS